MNNYFDLEKELNTVIEEYGAHDGYIVPTIEWTDNTYWSVLGVYEYWENNIKVSRVLDSPKVEPEFLRYIIFHEYTHQLYAEHDKIFKKEMSRYKDHARMEKMLNGEIGIENDDLPFAAPSLPPIDRAKPVYFCRLPYTEKDPEIYLRPHYINHYVVGELYGSIPDKYCNEELEQVIWVTEVNGELLLVGTARNVQLYPKSQIIRDGALFGNEGANAHIQFRCRQNDIAYLFPNSRIGLLAENEIPECFHRDNIFTDKDIPMKIYQDILDYYDKYDLDTHKIGMDDCEMDSQVPVFKSNDADELYERACAETDPYRRIWILNKCLAQKQNYRLYKDLASAYDSISVFDKALENYQNALEYRNQANVRARIETIQSVIPEYVKYGLYDA